MDDILYSFDLSNKCVQDALMMKLCSFLPVIFLNSHLVYCYIDPKFLQLDSIMFKKN